MAGMKNISLDTMSRRRKLKRSLRTRPFTTRGRKDRYRVIGQTDDGRWLTVIIAPRGGGVMYVLTAREATREERRAYQRH